MSVGGRVRKHTGPAGPAGREEVSIGKAAKAAVAKVRKQVPPPPGEEESIIADRDAKLRDAERRSTDRIKRLKDELHGLHEQLDTTRELYNKVRDARDEMRQDNMALKSEMEQFQRSLNEGIRIGNTASPGGEAAPPEKGGDNMGIDDVRAAFSPASN